MDIDDSTAYTTDRFDELTRVGRALELFEGEDKSPFVFGDGRQAQAWLLYGPFFDELSRAFDWVQADEALAADPDDAGARRRYDETAGLASDLDRPWPGHQEVLSPEQFVTRVPELAEQARAGALRPVAVGRAGEAEAVLIGHEDYRRLIQAQLRWRQSPPFLATLDPATHKPLAKSSRVDLDQFFGSLGPKSAEIWERVKREESSGQGS